MKFYYQHIKGVSEGHDVDGGIAVSEFYKIEEKNLLEISTQVFFKLFWSFKGVSKGSKFI